MSDLDAYQSARAKRAPKDPSDVSERSLDRVLHSHAHQLDDDEDFWFRLRGHNLNDLIDAATPLMGMVIRIRQLDEYTDIEGLYEQVVNEIMAIEVELTEKGYDRPTLLAYRYVLCSFIDEAVMGTRWGGQSAWAEHSLLTRFHNETWGGEKVFSILARLQKEPDRYREMLQFIYMCLCLGFEGRYKVMPDGHEECEQIIRALGEQLREHIADDDTRSDQLTSPLDNVADARYRPDRQMPVWGVFAIFAGVMVAIYLGLSLTLGSHSHDVISTLNQITS
ncbi:type IVB secretion system protein IcmH/DotU [Larsenimonas suaedae]|uniref:Type IVB secretion system protein IcmH/DotU n=1 Tax=Larsenimonas suaedae TaxID=1851019 RepID=A0ABU1GVN9_9GAMM|nr:type IVB secretion system protein IcmH/DotU [Larsenimonas suaedae]MCM2973207.1 type IVB secretion system protein IcmH/DotU [Larsenimonas suaedae]MDR5896100.1 type IVB secretion system protein IcmH/DotU [Larsenimonas suaedae]